MTEVLERKRRCDACQSVKVLDDFEEEISVMGLYVHICRKCSDKVSVRQLVDIWRMRR